MDTIVSARSERLADPGLVVEGGHYRTHTVNSAGFVALLGVPSFAYRHGWAPTSAAVAIVGDILVALGLYGSAFVYRENSFAAATRRNRRFAKSERPASPTKSKAVSNGRCCPSVTCEAGGHHLCRLRCASAQGVPPDALGLALNFRLTPQELTLLADATNVGGLRGITHHGATVAPRCAVENLCAATIMASQR
jgi:hypothetical protein